MNRGVAVAISCCCADMPKSTYGRNWASVKCGYIDLRSVCGTCLRIYLSKIILLEAGESCSSTPFDCKNSVVLPGVELSHGYPDMSASGCNEPMPKKPSYCGIEFVPELELDPWLRRFAPLYGYI